jgi:hypothetical protein
MNIIFKHVGSIIPLKSISYYDEKNYTTPLAYHPLCLHFQYKCTGLAQVPWTKREQHFTPERPPSFMA